MKHELFCLFAKTKYISRCSDIRHQMCQTLCCNLYFCTCTTFFVVVAAWYDGNTGLLIEEYSMSCEESHSAAVGHKKQMIVMHKNDDERNVWHKDAWHLFQTQLFQKSVGRTKFVQKLTRQFCAEIQD